MDNFFSSFSSVLFFLFLFENVVLFFLLLILDILCFMITFLSFSFFNLCFLSVLSIFYFVFIFVFFIVLWMIKSHRILGKECRLWPIKGQHFTQVFSSFSPVSPFILIDFLRGNLEEGGDVRTHICILFYYSVDPWCCGRFLKLIWRPPSADY